MQVSNKLQESGKSFIDICIFVRPKKDKIILIYDLFTLVIIG